MNILPAAKTVLCFGDSNTYGQRSDTSKARWPADVRWTGQLQKLLGDEYYVIEEGLSSRTTNIDYAQKPGRNGQAYLVPCLQSHKPLDYVVIMLGTNDLKTEFNRTPQDVARAVADLVVDVKQYGTGEHQPRIIVVSPIHIASDAPVFDVLYASKYDTKSELLSKELAVHLREVADREGCSFFDAAEVAASGEDGVHFSRESHDTFAKALAGLIKEPR